MKLRKLALILTGMSLGVAYATPAPATSNTPNPSNATSAASTANPVQAVQSMPVTTDARINNVRMAPDSAINSDTDKISYTLGVDMGRNLKDQSLSLNPSLFARGMTDGMAGGPFMLNDAQMKQALDSFKKILYAKQMENQQQVQAQQKALGDKNAKAGTAFLANNKTQPGVQTMGDGLQYKSLTAGTGATPTANDTVTVDYEGRLIDGTVFDSSYKQGQPVTFKVSEVIPGWQEALTHMKVGDEWEVYIPPQLAYGQQGVGGPIGPNQTLIFKIHLIDIKKPGTTVSHKASTTKKS